MVDVVEAATNRPMSHTPTLTIILRALYAEAIAAELEHLASFGERVTPDLLRRRAAYLRAGIRSETRKLANE